MLIRRILPQLIEEIQNSHAVAVLGPRQSGKTTVALEAAKNIPSIYLDLESERDRAKLAQPELYLSDHLDKPVMLDLLYQSGETLSGRIAYLELGPLNVQETGDALTDVMWLRGEFSESLTAPSDARSLRWRQNFIRTYLERDIPQFGPRMPPTPCAASGPCWPTTRAACSMWPIWPAIWA